MSDEPVRLSASQVADWHLCRRRWGIRRLDGLERSNPKADFGKAVHLAMEKWLRHAEAPDASTRVGLVAARLVPMVPAPRTRGLKAEHEFELRLPWATWAGFIDALHTGVDPIEVYDHKTTSNLRWAKSETELRDDLQACVYAAWACEVTRQPGVMLVWNYAETGAEGRTRRVAWLMSREEARARVERERPAAEEIAKARATVARGTSLEPRWRSCGAYGGCPYRDLCEPTPEKELEALMAQSVQERMRARIDAARAAKGGGTEQEDAVHAQAEQVAVAGSFPKARGVNPPKETTHQRAPDQVAVLAGNTRAARAAAGLTQPAAAQAEQPGPTRAEPLAGGPISAIEAAVALAEEHLVAAVTNPAGRDEQPVDLWRAQLLLDVAEKLSRMGGGAG